MLLVTPTLKIFLGFDLDAYKQKLLQRFSNASLNHRTDQIAQDGSRKIPQRRLSSVRQLQMDNRDTSLLALAVAGWIRYLQGYRDADSCGNQQHFSIIDPLSETLTSLVNNAEKSNESPVSAILKLQSILGALEQEQSPWGALVELYYYKLKSESVIEVLRER